MGKSKYKALRGGTKVALDQYNRIVREMPRHVEKRMQNIAARNEILHAAEAYNARLERDPTCTPCPRASRDLQRSIILVSWTPQSTALREKAYQINDDSSTKPGIVSKETHLQ